MGWSIMLEIVLIVILTMAYHRVAAVTALWIAVVLLLWGALSHTLSIISLLGLSGLWLVLLLLVIWPSLRQQLLTRYLLRWVARKTIKLSAAEQEVLVSGNTGWERQLFTGEPDWSLLSRPSVHDFPYEAQLFLQHQVKQVCELLDQAQFADDQDTDLPASVWQYLKTERFFGLTIPQQYGGHGFSPSVHSAVITYLASRSYSLAITVMVPNSVGPAELIKHYGTAEQKDFYLPRLANGQEMPCFALTSNEAGSDASSIVDTGVVCYGDFSGETILGIRLNWQKRHITLAPIATLIGLAFRLFDPQHLLGKVEDIGITLALVPTDCPGVVQGQRHKPMHLAFMNGPIEGNDVFIPLDWVVGGSSGCGHGWRMILSRFAVGRGISLPALINGAAQLCVLTSSAYALVRQQFQRSIGEFEGIQLKLAQVAGYAYLCQAMQTMLVQQIEQGAAPMVAAAIAKYHLTELQQHFINATMDVHAGRAVQVGLRNYLSSIYLATPINTTVEGANVLTRSLIILGQGLISGHGYLFQELKALQQSDPVLRLQQFDHVIWRHMLHVLSQAVRVTVYGLLRGNLPGKLLSNQPIWQQRLTYMSAAFSVLTDISLMVIGKQLKVREALSARLGDVLSYLYLASAVIKQFNSQRDDGVEYQLADWCVSYCLVQIQSAIDELLVNYPRKFLGKFLRCMIFPWGRIFYQPKDTLSFAIVDKLLKNAPVRQKLASNCHLGEASPGFRVEAAMRAMLRVAPILTKLASHFPDFKTINRMTAETEYYLQQAREQKLLTEPEEIQLRQMYHLCHEAILVDALADCAVPAVST